MTFDEAFTKLLGHEGAYSNHSADKGGETMWGVTKDTARRNGYLGDMRAMPVEVAKRIAKSQYWNVVSGDIMPPDIRFTLFDAAYNSGPGQAIKWLQRSVFVDDDGVIGPKTRMAAYTYKPAAICARFAGHRLMMMTDLKTWGTFGRGWSKRVASNLIETEG